MRTGGGGVEISENNKRGEGYSGPESMCLLISNR